MYGLEKLEEQLEKIRSERKDLKKNIFSPQLNQYCNDIEEGILEEIDQLKA